MTITTIETDITYDPATTITINTKDVGNSLMSTVTESEDTSACKSIKKDYFITINEHHNVVNKRDGNMWK